MSRTKGSGWGGGVMLYQICPYCNKKKCIYDPIEGATYYKPFLCLACKERNYDDKLIRSRYPKKNKINMENTFKVLMNLGKYVDESALYKGIYMTTMPTLRNNNETIESIANRWTEMNAQIGTPFISDTAIENLRKCELVEITLTINK